VSDKTISFTSAEWEACLGLPYLQRTLYLVLRWYMNVATRRTGDVRGISLQGLCEELYIEPAPGRSESGSPTKKAVRSALQQLEKHGLVQPCGNGEVLVFFLPKAGGGDARQKTKGHKRGTANGQAIGHSETLTRQGFHGEKGQAMGQSENAIKGHTSEVRVNPLSVEPASAARPLTVVQDLSTDELLQLPLNPNGVAEWIRLHERQRGRRAKVLTSDQRITEWIATGVRPEELQEAYQAAVQDRVDTKNPAPINLPFLDIFVKRVRESRRAARGGGAPRPELWHTTWDGLNRKAEELGIPPWDKDGREGFTEYQKRVLQASRAPREMREVSHA